MKRAFFVFGGGAVLIAAGVFVFMSKPAVAPDQLPTPSAPAIEESDLRDPDEIVVEGNRFTDTVQGYSGVIPEGWEIEKPVSVRLPLAFYSSEEFVCKIQSGFLPTIKSPNELIDDVKEFSFPYLTVNFTNEGDIEIDGYNGKYLEADTLEQNYSKSIYIARRNKIFSVVLFAEKTDVCEQVFQQFLAEISL